MKVEVLRNKFSQEVETVKLRVGDLENNQEVFAREIEQLRNKILGKDM